MPDWPNCNHNDIADAIKEFQEKLPDWWWSVGNCHLTADASCGPDRTGRDKHLLGIKLFDQGFHADLYHEDGATVADALRDVMRQALKARKVYI